LEGFLDKERNDSLNRWLPTWSVFPDYFLKRKN
jgi:hypothetical protein